MERLTERWGEDDVWVKDHDYVLCVSCAHKLRAWLSGKESDNG